MLSASALRLVARELKELVDKPEDGIRVRENAIQRREWEEQSKARGGGAAVGLWRRGAARPKNSTAHPHALFHRRSRPTGTTWPK